MGIDQSIIIAVEFRMRLQQDFEYRDEREPHAARTRAILRAHPEVRALIGRTRWTAFILVGLVVLQLALAGGMRWSGWWQIIAAAYLVGAFISHALFVIIHECTHNLVFPQTWLNRVAAMIANLPQVIPRALSFRRYHLKHHAYQGDYVQDLDLPSRWEARLIRSWFIGKALWLLAFPAFQLLRVLRVRHTPVIDRWVVANWSLQIVANVLVWYTLGEKALGFLTLSLVFSIGLHPLGARWIQEHFLLEGHQETFSYYGPLNRVALNVGYHNEHHDFPSIPWNRLPALRAAAPDAYNTLAAHHSWTRLLVRFLFDRELSLFSRMVRGLR